VLSPGPPDALFDVTRLPFFEPLPDMTSVLPPSMRRLLADYQFNAQPLLQRDLDVHLLSGVHVATIQAKLREYDALIGDEFKLIKDMVAFKASRFYTCRNQHCRAQLRPLLDGRSLAAFKVSVRNGLLCRGILHFSDDSAATPDPAVIGLPPASDEYADAHKEWTGQQISTLMQVYDAHSRQWVFGDLRNCCYECGTNQDANPAYKRASQYHWLANQGAKQLQFVCPSQINR